MQYFLPARMLAMIRVSSMHSRTSLGKTQGRPCVPWIAIRIARLARVRSASASHEIERRAEIDQCNWWTLAIGDWGFRLFTHASWAKSQLSRHIWSVVTCCVGGYPVMCRGMMACVFCKVRALALNNPDQDSAISSPLQLQNRSSIHCLGPHLVTCKRPKEDAAILASLFEKLVGGATGEGDLSKTSLSGLCGPNLSILLSEVTPS